MTDINTETTNGPKRFELVKPYNHRGTRIDVLTAREPKVRDLRQFLKMSETDSIGAVATTLANLCSVDEHVIAEMSFKDFGIMRRWYESFLEDLIRDSEM